MKNTILLDTGVLSLYLINDEILIKELSTSGKKNYVFLSSEVNFIELYNHLCREKGKINAQIIMENLRRRKLMEFIPVSNTTSALAGELKCIYHSLSIVDSIICAEALKRKTIVYTTETHFKEIKDLKVKKFNF